MMLAKLGHGDCTRPSDAIVQHSQLERRVCVCKERGVEKREGSRLRQALDSDYNYY